MIYTTTVSFASGILLQEIFGISISSSILIIFVALLVSSVIRKENKEFSQKFFIIFFSLFIGVVRIGLVDTSLDPKLLQHVASKIVIEASVVEEPDVRDTNTRYTVKPYESDSKILLIADSSIKLDYGDKIKFEGRLDLPENFTTDSGTEFDYISYLQKDKIHFLVWYPNIEIVEDARVGPLGSLYNFKSIFIEKIAMVVPEPNSSLLAGLIFGVKQSLGTQLLEEFRKVGLIHVVVLSGYNITIIAAGVFFLTNKLGRRNAGFVSAAIFIALFAIMVGLSATVVRASIMALIAILARFLGRPADALRWLFIAGSLMLLYNPLSLSSDPSFQLSFMATLGLIIFSPYVYSFISKYLSFITERFHLREIVASTIAVQIFVLPLLIRMSGEVSIISFLVNPLLLPFVPWAMGFGALTGALGVIPFIGKIISWPFGIISYAITELIIKTVEVASSIPLGAVSVGSLSLLTIIIWYAFYGFVYFKMRNRIIPN